MLYAICYMRALLHASLGSAISEISGAVEANNHNHQQPQHHATGKGKARAQVQERRGA